MPVPTALIVEPVLFDALFLVATATSLGFQATVAATFQEGVERLRLSPLLLMTDIRLAQYNGLHLVLRGKSAKPDLAAIVTSAVPDPVLQAEAERLGATFVLKPTSSEELRAAISRTLLRSTESPGPIRPPFERRKSERRAPTGDFLQPDRRTIERRRDIAQVIQQTGSA
jgi:DNA-binding response OmpR family regulator